MQNKFIEIIKNLETPGTIVVTANQRLAQVIQNRFNHEQQENHKLAWESAKVFPWTEWIKENLRRNQPDKFILSDDQDQWLWQQTTPNVVNECLSPLLSIDSAKKANQILKLWRLPVDVCKHGNFENRIFYNWQQKYEQACRNINAINNAEIADILLNNDQRWLEENVKKIIWLGFQQTPPQTKTLMQQCAQWVECESYTMPHNENAETSLLVCKNKNQEWQNMTTWLQQQELKHAHQIGCIVSNLQQERHNLLNFLRRAFPEHSAENPIYNLSVGLPVSSYPLLKEALDCLEWLQHTPDMAAFSHFIQSPLFTRSVSEQIAAARCDRELRRMTDRICSKEQLIECLMQIQKKEDKKEKKEKKEKKVKKEDKKSIITIITSRWINALKQAQNHNYYASLFASEWSSQSTKQLEACGWPGQFHFDSEGFQLWQRWEKNLNTVKDWDQLSNECNNKCNNKSNNECSSEQYLNSFRRMLDQQLFQPQSKKQAPIQIMGAIEAIDLPFTSIWISGFDENNWPSATKPNPLIPLHIQREHDMPHASQQREWTYCKETFFRLSEQAQQTICSYVSQTDIGTQKPSKLAHGLKTYKHIKAKDEKNSESEVWQAAEMETITHDQTLPLTKNQQQKGGARVLQQQATCPFQAFAQWRLEAKPLDQWSTGPDHRERGTVLHDTLQGIWEHCQDQKTLLSMSEQEISALIEEKVALALQELSKRRRSLIHASWEECEKKLLKTVCIKWINYEKQRPHFRVLGCETEIDVDITNLKLKCRIDRVDECEDGSVLLIDYKTGHCNSSDWQGPRMRSPQLPLYVTNYPQKVSGVAFAQCRSNEQRFKGLSKNKLDISGIRTVEKTNTIKAESWDELQQQWQNECEQLSDDFAQGVADVNPHDINRDCKQCDFRSLCRLPAR